MQDTLRIAVVQGSIREGRFNDTVTRWTVDGLSRHGFDTTVIDPRDPALLPIQIGETSAADVFRDRIAGIDGFVIVTPEYNHAAPGPLKTLIDSTKDEWAARAVGFVSYGGVSGGLRAVESLRPVFAELRAVTIRETISFASPWSRFSEAARIVAPEDAASTDAAMDTFADDLTWWAHALRDARLARPYRQKAA
ncbi:NADPH-dependent FMN reductase [Psychromarinibacter sp. S121]|uniref:NADPH-dependent FMN reductase n=1 Tax=Psychromarinibacter sp. S121 TaxID=3415127 RepID=UPI003C7CECF4